ncbi:MAG: serine/threonine-protein kinase, partial [Candidatus Riflebacteria bacterium]|nr:serine/threonine-protein kinase [Candidatus Riflebacteria bacterium]
MPKERCPACQTEIEHAADSTLLECPSCGVSSAVPDAAQAPLLTRSGADAPRISGQVPLPRPFRDRYKTGRVIGVGAMATVYLARDTVTGNKVAIKFLSRLDSPDILARFLQEGRILMELRHPNVVRVTEVCELGGHPCLICEHLEGGTLRDRLKEKRRFAPLEASLVMLDVLAGLEACHSRGIVHRDLKPENILFTKAG